MKRYLSEILNLYRNYITKKRIYLDDYVTIRKEFKNFTSLSKSDNARIKNFYLKYNFKNITTDWHSLYYNINQEFHEEYIPVDFFYKNVLLKLNDSRFTEAYADKNQYKQLFPNFEQPKTILNIRNGLYFLNNKLISKNDLSKVLPQKGKYIIKPSINTLRGEGIRLFDAENFKEKESVCQFIQQFGSNIIIQEIVESHPILKSLNPSSLNTIRIMTIRIKDEVKILSQTLKIGSPGQIVDNGHHGGAFCGINNNGILKKYVYTLTPFSKNTHTKTGIKVEGIKIPGYDKLIKKVKENVFQLPYHNVIGWDIAINQDEEPILIEINLKFPGINIMQIPNGPLFGEYKDEIFNYLKELK